MGKFETQHSKFIIVILVLLAAAGLNHYFSKPDISLPRKSLAEFPMQLGDWAAISEQKIEGRSMDILQVDDYFMRNYRNSNGDVIGLYVGYFKSQREGKGIHSPRQCLPGSGWVPVNTSVYYMPVSSHNSEAVPVNKFIMGKGLDRQLYLFWYHGRGRVYASEYWNKIYLIWDGLTKKRTDGALVRVNTPVIGDTEDALKTQSDFIMLFLPLLKEYIPD
ncbi:MAG: exosortase C-terminal domain/associated protein EpsI [Pseudobdellovibrionaceae bacterium]